MESFLIIGAGRFGSALACELASLGHEVLVIDKSEEKIEAIADYVTHSVIADARDEGVMDSLGVVDFDVAVVANAGSIEDSVLVTIMLKERGVRRVIAKANDMLHMKVLERLGADEIVLPERDMGKRLAQRLSSKNIVDYIELSEEYSIVEIGAPLSWREKTFAELDVRRKYGMNIIAVRNDNDGITVSPTANYKIKAEDILVVLGRNEDIKKLRGE